MVTELRVRNVAQQLYVRALGAAYRSTIQLWDPSLWLTRDPEIEEKMLRDADIAHAIDYRCRLVAGQQWSLVPLVKNSPKATLAVGVGTSLLQGIKQFTLARQLLARAFFHGARFSRIHGCPRKLRLGDGKVRTWWVPTRLEDFDKRMYRIVPTHDYEEHIIRAHWQRWDIERSDWVDETMQDAVRTIRHVYEDDQATLGYGRALREALGWWWYAKTNVFQESLVAVERFAQGILTAKVQGARDASTNLPNTELIRAWTEVLEDLRSRHVLVYDESDQVEMIQMNSAGWELLKEVRDELKATILTLILSANLPTGADSGGSYALAAEQGDSTEKLIEFDREVLEERLTDDLLGCVWFRNRANLIELGIHEEKPRFNITQQKQLDPQVRATVAATLTGIGLPISKAELYEQTGFRQPEEGEPVLEPPAPPQQPPLGGGGPFGFRAGGEDGIRFANERGLKPGDWIATADGYAKITHQNDDGTFGGYAVNAKTQSVESWQAFEPLQFGIGDASEPDDMDAVEAVGEYASTKGEARRALARLQKEADESYQRDLEDYNESVAAGEPAEVPKRQEYRIVEGNWGIDTDGARPYDERSIPAVFVQAVDKADQRRQRTDAMWEEIERREGKPGKSGEQGPGVTRDESGKFAPGGTGVKKE